MKRIKLFENFKKEEILNELVTNGKVRSYRVGKFIKLLFDDKYSNEEIENMIKNYSNCIVEYNDDGHYARLIDDNGRILFSENARPSKEGFMRVTRLLGYITDGTITNQQIRNSLGLSERWPFEGRN